MNCTGDKKLRRLQHFYRRGEEAEELRGKEASPAHLGAAVDELARPKGGVVVAAVDEDEDAAEAGSTSRARGGAPASTTAAGID